VYVTIASLVAPWQQQFAMQISTGGADFQILSPHEDCGCCLR